MTRHRGSRFVLVALFAVCAVTVTAVAPGTSGAVSPGALPPELVATITVAGSFGVPADAEMVALEVTAVLPDAPGYITVWPCEEERPGTSNVNFLAGQIVPNFVLARIDSLGDICVFSLALTDVLIDVVGYVPAGSSIEALPVPGRVLDSRAEGGVPSPVPAGSVTSVPIAGIIGIPTGISTVVVNATAVAARAPGYLTVYPCGTVPATSSVNYLGGDYVANIAVSALDGGSLCVYTSADADIVIDVAAYGTGGIETLATPERIVDTRTGPAPQEAGGVLEVAIASRPDVPDDATAAVYNLTSDRAAAPGYATSYPCGAAPPTVSNLNYFPSRPVASGTITGLDGDGDLCIYNSSATDLIVDLIGWTRGTAAYVPVVPVRALDTRAIWDVACDIALASHDTATGVPQIEALRSGSPVRTVLDMPPINWMNTIIGPDCASAYVVNSEAAVYRVPLDGSPHTLVIDTNLYAAYSTLHAISDGRVLLLGATEDSTQWVLLDIDTGDTIQTFDLSGLIPSNPVLSADGEFLSYDDGTNKVVVVASKQIIFSQVGLGNAAISPDGSMMAYFFLIGEDIYYEVATLDREVLYRWVVPIAAMGGSPGFGGRHWWAGPGVLVLPKVGSSGAFRVELYDPTLTPLFSSEYFALTGTDFLLTYR